MVFPSIYYFLYYGAISILFPFLALFYQSQGLTGGADRPAGGHFPDHFLFRRAALDRRCGCQPPSQAGGDAFHHSAW